MTPANVTFRPGRLDDTYTAFLLFEESLADLARRMGQTDPMSFDDPETMAMMWVRRRSLYEHLARTADQFWLAEQDGQAVGFSRSIVRDGHWELTELFVKPGVQSAGLGRELLRRAAPSGPVTSKLIVASPDLRAQALYMKLGTYPRFPIYYWWREPEAVEFTTDLVFEPIAAGDNVMETLASIDRQVLGYRRDAEHDWLLSDRQGYLVRRNGEVVGYGYEGRSNGPFALLDPADFPAILAHAETAAARTESKPGRGHFGVEIPMVNTTAVAFLLDRGYRMDRFIAHAMIDHSVGQFDRYALTSPPFFV